MKTTIPLVTMLLKSDVIDKMPPADVARIWRIYTILSEDRSASIKIRAIQTIEKMTISREALLIIHEVVQRLKVSANIVDPRDTQIDSTDTDTNTGYQKDNEDTKKQKEHLDMFWAILMMLSDMGIKMLFIIDVEKILSFDSKVGLEMCEKIMKRISRKMGDQSMGHSIGHSDQDMKQFIELMGSIECDFSPTTIEELLLHAIITFEELYFVGIVDKNTLKKTTSILEKRNLGSLPIIERCTPDWVKTIREKYDVSTMHFI